MQQQGLPTQNERPAPVRSRPLIYALERAWGTKTPAAETVGGIYILT